MGFIGNKEAVGAYCHAFLFIYVALMMRTDIGPVCGLAGVTLDGGVMYQFQSTPNYIR